MKIYITSNGDSPDSTIDPRFGRCRYFAIYDTDSDSFEFIENPNKDVVSGAGVLSAQFIIEKGCRCVITGRVGPKAREALEAGRVNIIEEVKGTVKSVVEDFKKNDI